MNNVNIQETEKITINIDTTGYKEKPENSFGYINNRVADNIEEMSLSEFADQVGNHGKAFTRAYLKGGRRTESFVQQKLLVLDFDQKEEKISYEEFCDRCSEYNVPFAFTYKTFGYDGRKKYFKFRAVFVMDIMITDVRFAKAVNKLFQSLFPEGDTACTDIPRLFFGGKGIIDSNLDARVDVMNIFPHAVEQIKIKSGDNFSRDVKTFAGKIKVAWDSEKSEFAFYRKEEIDLGSIQGEWIEQDGIIMLYGDIVTGDIEKIVQSNSETENTFNVINGYSKERLMQICPLLADFDQKAKISNNEMFLLATNLRYIKGGRTIFFDILKSKDLKEWVIKKWEGNWERDIIRKDYHPQECKKVCKYAEICNCYSLYQKLSMRIKRIEKEEDYFPLNVCEQELEGCLTEAIENPENVMRVIVAQTGLGKTEIYCRKVASMPGKKFIIAVPTCNLQNEVADRLEAKGVTCYRTSSRVNNIKKLGLDDLYEEACELYNQGFGIMIRTVIKKYMAEHQDDLNDYHKKGLKEILNAHKCPREQCIVTTHAYLMMMNLEEYWDYEIIIDEDILMTLFKRNGVISLQNIRQLLKSKILTKEIKNFLKKIMKMDDKETRKLKPVVLDKHVKIRLYKSGSTFHNALPLLLESSSVAMDREEEQVMFFNRKDLPNRKITIVSASANKKLYQKYFSDRKVLFYAIHKAEYVGKVIQYSAHTMSRRCMEMTGLDTVFQKVREITGDIPVITFKMAHKGPIYFGKTEGFDEYCGKDIAVVGTPHSKPLYCMLLAEELGYIKKNVSYNLNSRRVVRNGYEFKIMSFEEADIQNLELFLVETELEQAIGRSRVLRKPCTVYVFSNYPCAQAELIQTKYLPEIKDEEEMECGEIESKGELVEDVKK